MYANLKKIYKETHPAMFNMAIAYLLDVGFSDVKEIKDEEIETLEDSSLLSADFKKGIVRTARAIALECGNDVVEIIQFCQVENVFSTEWYAPNEEEDEDDDYDYEGDM